LLTLPKNGSNEIQFTGSLPYRILTKCVEGFLEYKEKFIYGHMKTRFYYKPIWTNTEIVQQLSVEVFHVEFQ
jgi:hypothetical protein